MTDPDETKRDAVLPHLGETAAPAPEAGALPTDHGVDLTTPPDESNQQAGPTPRPGSREALSAEGKPTVDANGRPYTTPPPNKPKRVDSKAATAITVTLEDGTVLRASTAINTFCVMEGLTALLQPVQEKLQNATCLITVPAIDGDDKQIVHTLYSGPVNDVAQQIVNNLLPEPVLVMELYRMMQQAISHSKMAGYIVTLLLPNQQPVLFSNINPTLGAAVTPEDINMLVAQAVNSIADFKDKMRKAGHVFPEDPGTILTPGGNGKGLILPGRR